MRAIAFAVDWLVGRGSSSSWGVKEDIALDIQTPCHFVPCSLNDDAKKLKEYQPQE